MISYTYTNNSPDALRYLWVQLDQNIRKKDAPALEKNGGGAEPILRVETFVNDYFKEPFDGGFNIDWVKDANGLPMKYTINMTMMNNCTRHIHTNSFFFDHLIFILLLISVVIFSLWPEPKWKIKDPLFLILGW